MQTRAIVYLALVLLLARVSGAMGTDEIDAWALRPVPESVASAVDTLAAYLTQPTRTDREKARVLFRWITANISYDAAGLRSGNYGDCSPAGVLRRRMCVCAGYANLYTALATAAGLEARTVTGYAKGYGFAVGGSLDGPENHAWNAVKIDGQWQLCDPTWGAGYLDERGQFVRHFFEHYYRTPPAEFIFDHLPGAPHWQLLTPPVSKQAFSRFALVSPTYFLCQLRVDSHPDAVVPMAGDLRLTLLGPANVVLMTRLLQGARQLPDSCTFVQHEDDRIVVRVAVPAPGNYTLRIFAKRLGETGPYANAMDYHLEATAAGMKGGFPSVLASFNQGGVCLTTPLTGVLAANNPVPLDLSVPGAVEVVAVTGNGWTQLAHQGDRFSATIRPPAGEVQICARYPGAKEYAVLLHYTVE